MATALNTVMTDTFPVLFDIKRYAIHDGPNIRTTIFMKGCPLSCSWCHNPEGLSKEVELLADFEKCIGCRACLDVCLSGSLKIKDKKISRDRASCVHCHECLEICPALVFETTGWIHSTETVMEEIKKDIPFFDQSGGGVTFSGGDPLMQKGPLLGLLGECGKLGIHRVVDTSGYAQQEDLLQVAALTDLFLIDIKLMDEAAHKKFTGVGNRLILSNIRLLVEMGHQVILRVPLIPTVNDHQENMLLLAEFVHSLPKDIAVELLPYHSAARAKYQKLDLPYQGENIPGFEKEILDKTISLLQQNGVQAQAG